MSAETHTLAFEHLNAELTIDHEGNAQVAFRDPEHDDNPTLLSYQEFEEFAAFAARHVAADGEQEA